MPWSWRGRRTTALHRELALPVPGRVEVTGRVSPSDLDALYRAADAFAYPSLYEGFGLPVLEAMARGVPVVAAGTTSIPEVTGDTALLVDPRSVEELAGALERLLTHPEQAQQLATAGLARSARFSWDRTALATAAVYDAVVGR
jgi:glycosyltransferase involved in cell wall biosynthesis